MGSLREDIEASSAAITETAPEPAPVIDATPAPEPAEASATPTPETPTPERADGRDDKGRFAPKATAGDSPGQAAPKVPPTSQAVPGAASSTQPPAPAQATQTEPPKPGEPDIAHAPQSWPIGMRQSWEQLSPEMRKFHHARELQVAQAISKSAPDRQLATEVRKTFAPLEAHLQARGITPQRLIAEYVGFDKALSSRDPNTQAVALAQVIKGYGVPLEALADALDGKLGAPQQPPQSVEEIRAQVRAEEAAKWQQQQQQHEYRAHAQRVQEFAKNADPILFNDDVRHDMAALIEAAAARNVELSLQEAYDRAVRANPEAWAIVQQREQAKLAPTQQQATAKSLAAASSVKTRPASPVGGESSGSSLRADLEAEAARQAGRM